MAKQRDGMAKNRDEVTNERDETMAKGLDELKKERSHMEKKCKSALAREKMLDSMVPSLEEIQCRRHKNKNITPPYQV